MRIARRPLLLLAALVLAPSGLSAQSAPGPTAPGRLSIPLSLQIGLPQGEFARNVDVAGGFGLGLMWTVGDIVGLRADFGGMVYGSQTRRVPLGGGALGLINVDVTTTNGIFGGGIGAQVGVPGPHLMPYLGGEIGFSSFTTSSSVEGSNSSNQPFASSTNYSDGTFAKTLYGGLYLPIAGGKTMIDLGVRYTWNGERVRYLTEGDIVEDPSGNVVFTPRESRADLLTIVLGVTLRPGRPRR
jgi:hypothetical protein